MRWLIAGLGVAMLVVAAALPWFLAQAIDGSALMYGWGRWSVSGAAADARLEVFPIGLLVAVPVGFMIACSVRSRFGNALLCAMLAAAASILAFMLKNAVAGHSTGGAAVFVQVDSAPRILLVLAVAAAICAWFSLSRSVLRDPPR